MSQLKTQIMTMFMMKSASDPQGKSRGSSDIFNILYSMMMLSMVEWLFKQAPSAFLAIKTYLLARYSPKTPAWLPLADKPKKEAEQLNSITMTRFFKDVSNGTPAKDVDRADNIYVEKVDAVLDYICNIDNARHVRMDVRCSLNNVEEIELTPLLKAKVKQTNGSEVNIVELVLFSSVLKISDIRNWVDDVHSNYVAEKNNKLGNKIYYFNEVLQEPIVQMDLSCDPPRKTYRWDNMPKMLSFNMSEFKTSKSFSNVYGDHVDELKERLDLFVNHPEWYMERGIPHSLGIMLHGVPGAGKTSTIKAIAKDTNRHIFNLSLRPFTTQRQLTNLFFNETVSVYTYDGGKQTLKIPLNRRVYVIEDIDCLTDVVLDRSIVSHEASQDGDAVTLSFLLNLLDGVLETPGRILVITSNYPEKLDKALVRPGRIDVKIHFKNATRTFILDMINKFYTIDMTLDEIPAELEDVFTPAEVMESLCYYFKSPSQALVHLVNKHQSKKLLEVQKHFGTSLADLGIDIVPVAQEVERKQIVLKEEQEQQEQQTQEHQVKSAIHNELVSTTPPRLTIFPEENKITKVTETDLRKASVLLGMSGFDSGSGSLFDSPLFQNALPPEGAGGRTFEEIKSGSFVSSHDLNEL